MKLDIDLDDYRINGTGKRFSMKKMPTKVKNLYRDEAHYDELLAQYRTEISDMQAMLYAHDRYALLLVFQAMDAAGKDGTIKHVMSGVDPQGVEVHAFKRPSDDELDHDFMWRSSTRLPPRGRIGIFNRSYYEEVLICQVHPEIVQKYQRLPDSAKKDMSTLFDKRREDIAAFEAYAHRNGTRIVKFMLNVSQDEQKARFMERIDTPAKNWKFNAADVAEREHWDEYMKAYDAAINTTATKESPWYVVPADGKKNTRLIISAAILEEMKRMDLHWPVLPEAQLAELAKSRALLMAEK
jgi:PPK2 family polyphosphate:nucleotide phosphotransferase